MRFAWRLALRQYYGAQQPRASLSFNLAVLLALFANERATALAATNQTDGNKTGMTGRRQVGWAPGWQRE